MADGAEAPDLLPDGSPWRVVERREQSAGRVRLGFLLPPGTKRYVNVDHEQDNPEGHARIAQALLSDNWRIRTTQGVEPKRPPGPSGWLSAP